MKVLLATIKEALKGFWAFTGGIPYLRWILFGAGLAVAMIVFFTARSCESRTEKKIDHVEANAVSQKTETNSAAVNVEAAKENSKSADAAVKDKVKKAEEVRQANTKDTSFEEANKARCAAYTEDCK